MHAWTIAASSGSSGSMQNFTSLSVTGARDTIGFVSDRKQCLYECNASHKCLNLLALLTEYLLTISSSLKVDNGGLANTK